MNLVVIRPAIAALIASLAGLQDGAVQWANTIDGATYITDVSRAEIRLDLLPSQGNTLDSRRYVVVGEDVTTGAGSGVWGSGVFGGPVFVSRAKLVEYRSGIRKCHLQISCDSLEVTDLGVAMGVLETIRTKLQWGSSRAALSAVGICVQGRGDILTLPLRTIDGRATSSATFDVLLSIQSPTPGYEDAAADTANPIDWIETVNPITPNVS